jgi:hypothetical protein
MLDRLRGFMGRGDASQGKATYLGLRSMVFTLDPATVAVRPGSQVHGAWCAAVDFGLASGTATLVAIADGTVSMYASGGGGVIGAGSHEAVWAVAERFLETAAGAAPFMHVVADVPPTPADGHVRLSVRTFEGTLSEDVSEEAVQRGRHELAPFYAAGQDLVTEIRLSTEQREG